METPRSGQGPELTDPSFVFGSFEVQPSRRTLLAEGKPLPISSRGFDLLCALIRRAGQIVSKEELIEAAWPATTVDEASLRVQIATLRKVLGESTTDGQVIKTVPSRGYCFIAPLQRTPALPPGLAVTPASGQSSRSLPQLRGRVIGREGVIAALAKEIDDNTPVTIVGHGGIGKTTVALSVARAVASRFPDGAVFVDLTSVGENRSLLNAMADALGYLIMSDDPGQEIATYVANKRLLVVLDNCEHLIAGAATLVDMLGEAQGVRVLATSREDLRAAREWVHRLQPLGLPEPSATALSAAEAMRSAAVELFVERASARLGGYVLTDGDAQAVVEICRRLDGMALAIELAAGRVDTIGIQGLAGSLDDSLHVLTQGRRTALPRHQTLRGTLDWSYRLLTTSEQAVLRRLSKFRGPFTIRAACFVAADDELPEREIAECVRSLVVKSLVVVDLKEASPHYRLLTTTRAFAKEQIAAAHEEGRTARQHADYLHRVFEQAQLEWETRPTTDWLADYSSSEPDLRSALEWAFAHDGNAQVGVALTVAAVPLWLELSRVTECLEWVQCALSASDKEPQAYRRQRMQLQAVFALPNVRAIAGQLNGPGAWATTLQIAEELGDTDFQLRALWALWAAHMNLGEPDVALGLADRFCALEDRYEKASQRIGPRVRARSLHLLGDQPQALSEVDTMLSRYSAPIHRSHIARFQYDQRVTARITRARVLWTLGRPDQAMREVHSFIAQAELLSHALTLTLALADGACPVALFVGDLMAAERFIEMLHRNTEARSLDVWHSYADCFRGELLIRRGDAVAGVAVLQDALALLQQAGFIIYMTMFKLALVHGLTECGRAGEALAVVEAALLDCDQSGERWCVPELLRWRGLLWEGEGQGAAAEACYRESLRLAEQQGALSWVLRTATSLSGYLWQQGRRAEAVAVLAPVHAGLTEGFATPDVLAASALLEQIRSA